MTGRHGSKGPWGCPAQACSSGRAELQQPLAAGQRAAVMADPLVQSLVADDQQLRRCGACGAVYLAGARRDHLGFLEDGGSEQGWRPLPLHHLG